MTVDSACVTSRRHPSESGLLSLRARGARDPSLDSEWRRNDETGVLETRTSGSGNTFAVATKDLR